MQVSAFRVLVLVMACALVVPVVGLAQDTSVADARFKALDVNEDGGLSTYEFNSDAAMRMMDEDHDNLVSASELQAFFGPENPKVATAAERIVGIDLDNDGQLSADELHVGLERRYKFMDKNKDGNVDLAEFRAASGVSELDHKGRVAH